MIDRQSPVPIYFQIEEYIKQLIENQALKPGDAIPSEREFTETFQVSRMTVRQAITNLVNEGTLIRLKGKGTFISDQKIEQPLQGLTSFTEDMQKRGLKPGSRLVHFGLIPASAGTAHRLNINEHDPIYEIKRIRLADDMPMALEIMYLSANLVKGLTEKTVNQSLYSYIEKTLGLKIGHANQVLESSVARAEEAKYLGIEKNAPILLIQRHTFLENGAPLELVKSTYRGDRYKFVIDMKRG
ncbi:GntR family transcriptional regulator [Scopulibacillus darangshiensis]|uniref:GntR family transcriptional regulator n=1 Tax=Scopulibacillus darangshiensis TaxID=442528 RepID=A0A4V2SN85_9BACL|nr:GntR family transcriptional regulator [Scopulibacillus darangshiensis]TCP30196.1 GntR family transcriptional regulator [Scopulibacillus darangshiensis]